MHPTSYPPPQVFGAPLPCEDHCERAVRAVLQMIELIEQYNVERTARQYAPIRIGIGIASGKSSLTTRGRSVAQRIRA